MIPELTTEGENQLPKVVLRYAHTHTTQRYIIKLAETGEIAQ